MHHARPLAPLVTRGSVLFSTLLLACLWPLVAMPTASLTTITTTTTPPPDATAAPPPRAPLADRPVIQNELRSTCDPARHRPGLRIGVMGDIFVGSRAEKRLAAETGPTLQQTLAMLKQAAPILVGNLEGVLTRRTERAFPEQPFAHRMNPKLAEQLASWGLSGLTLANNHTMDYGALGLSDTQTALAGAALQYAGAGENLEAAEQPMVFEHHGLKAHILSFNVTLPEAAWARHNRPGVAYPQTDRMQRRIEQSAREADLVIVSFHWGQEGTRTLRDYQRVFARAAVAAGADFVYGHHTHTVQPIEQAWQSGAQSTTTIAYGLGNFVFDSYSSVASFGLAALVELCATDSRTARSSPAERPPQTVQFPQTSQPSAASFSGPQKPERRIAVTFVPLYTFNYVTHFGTVPMTRAQFTKAAKDYFQDGDFPAETRFWLPGDSSPEEDPKEATGSAATLGQSSSARPDLSSSADLPIQKPAGPSDRNPSAKP